MSTLAFILLGLVAEVAVVWLAYWAGYDSGIAQD